MVQKLGPKDLDVTIKFGGGLHTRASEDEIDAREAADGQNFLLDLENRELRPRPPFDLVGTVPNAAEIRGGGSYLKADGTASFIIQAGNKVYSWDGVTTFTEEATVNANSKLRGHHRTHSWALDDKLLLTDLALLETVKEWDGSNLTSSVFTKGPSAEAFGTFYAKYLSVADERAMFSNVKDAGGALPHMMVGSERSNYLKISVADRPSSSLSEADPFFLLTPDLRPINGHVEAFGSTILSTEHGEMFNLTGTSAKDFAFSNFYPGSAASGDEPVAYVGNDILYGRQGRIESLRDTDRFGDSEADDVTKPVANETEDYEGWTIVYNARLNRAYCFPAEGSECWVLQNTMRGGQVSPWMRWTTDHALAFRPTFVMPMLDPADGLEYVFMGDEDGNLYRLEGSGTDGDGGDTEIAVEWLTKLFSTPVDTQAFALEGWVKYRKNVAFQIQLVFELAGETASRELVTINVPGVSGAAHFGGAHYFGGTVYFGALVNRLIRQRYTAAGQASDFQVRVRVVGTDTFAINEIGVRGTAASQ